MFHAIACILKMQKQYQPLLCSREAKKVFFFIYILGCHLPRRVAHAISELLLIFLTEKMVLFLSLGLDS